MNKTSIEWTENTWNPITGCTQLSEGCRNCYAKRMAKRLKAMGNPRYTQGFEVSVHEDIFDAPLRMKKPQVIFVCSMSDLFHESVSDEVLEQIFTVMEEANWHIFQVLTKRSSRLRSFSEKHIIPNNVWVGTSVESIDYQYRINDLQNTKATTKFLSCEPLLGSLSGASFYDIDWIVVGGESGPNARPIEKKWVEEIRDSCQDQNIRFFFKQWGGFNKKKNGRELDGKIYNQMPDLPITLGSESHI